MAETMISQLPDATDPDGTELFPVVQAGVTRRLLLSQCEDLFGGGGSITMAGYSVFGNVGSGTAPGGDIVTPDPTKWYLFCYNGSHGLGFTEITAEGFLILDNGTFDVSGFPISLEHGGTNVDLGSLAVGLVRRTGTDNFLSTVNGTDGDMIIVVSGEPVFRSMANLGLTSSIILYPGVSGTAWSFPYPDDVQDAIDRLIAWFNFNSAALAGLGLTTTL